MDYTQRISMMAATILSGMIANRGTPVSEEGRLQNIKEAASLAKALDAEVFKGHRA